MEEEDLPGGPPGWAGIAGTLWPVAGEAPGRQGSKRARSDACRGTRLPLQTGGGNLFERGLLVNAVTPTALRLLPPLTISKEDLEEGLAILYGVLAEKCG